MSAFVLISLQVGVAFNIVYNSGLNEYALYLNCEGRGGFHPAYERAMSHLFKDYRKRSNNVSDSAQTPFIRHTG